DVPEGLFHEIPPHRITRLRRQGERYFADGLRELPDNRRLAILAVCAVEWELFLADAVVETHDRLVGRTYREAARACEAQLGDETAAARESLRAFAELGTALLGARDAGEALDAVIADGPGWEGLGDLVAKAAALASTAASDPMNHVLGGYSRFRRYTPRMLRTLDIEASPAAEPLLDAVDVLRSDGTARPTGFLRPNSRWRRLLRTQSDHRLWETAVLFHLRDAFRAGDVWLARSRRYGDIRKALLSTPAGDDADRSLPVPASPHDWLAERRSALDEGLRRLAAAARARAPAAGGSIEDSVLRVERTETAVPDGAADLVADLYRRLPEARITDILLEVDDATRFTEAFTHLRTGEPCRDRIGLLNVLLAEGINLGLRKMAEATNTHGFWELMRIARWHVEGDAFDRALAVVVEAQAALPMAAFWGSGRTASSDGQFFPAGGRGEALNLVNARYGAEPGVKAYSHVSDRFSPFATQTIPATVHEAPYILDGLLMNETGRRVREQYADTGGFTDHVFAACSILGYAFVPRIRDLPSKRLYVFERAGVPKRLRPLVGGKVNVDLIDRNWADILRVAATMAAGTMRPSQLLRKLAAYPRQNELAAALREVGRIERSLFMIEWTTDPDVRRRALVGLNKGEAHHALKRAINFHQRGELRDRTGEGQHYRVAGLNLLAAIIIYWNTLKLGDAVFARGQAGLEIPDELLAHVSPLGWEHINLTGEYRWPGAERRAPRNP
ncbi:MAG: Tn3 family transposase, partial [Rhodospirillaceae bacterium]|nr:Tn3 family transposase [Rhodospirillaceae bacterium]